MSKLRECVSKMGFAWGFRAIGFQIEAENGKSEDYSFMQNVRIALARRTYFRDWEFLSYVNYPIIGYTNQFFFKKTRGFQYDRYIYSVLLIVCKLFLWIRNCDEIILFEIIIFFIRLNFILLNFIIWYIILASERDTR